MSLIQEALRKQQEEMDAAQTSPGDAQPEQPQEQETPIKRSALRTKPLAAKEPQTSTDATSEPAQEAHTEETPSPATLKPRVTPTSEKDADKEETPTQGEKTRDDQEKGGKETSIWPSLLGALAFLTVIALLLYGSWYGYLMLRRGQETSEVSESAPPQEIDEVAADAPTPTPDTPVPSATVPVASDPPKKEDVAIPEPEVVEPVAEVVDLPGPPIEVIAPEPPVIPTTDIEPEAPIVVDTPTVEPPPEPLPAIPSTTSDTTSPAVKPSPAVTPSPTKQPQPAEKEPWPALTLDGFVGRGRSGTAVLNGEIVPVGNTIQDVEVMLIESRSVILKYNGQLRRIRRGQTTD